MTPFVLAALIASQQDLTKPVDYTTRAKPIADVLIELTKQTGLNLVCTPDLDHEPIILKFNHVPLKEAMDKIAFVTAGEWRHRDREWDLQRSTEADKRHDACIKKNAELWKQGYDTLAKKLKLEESFSEQSAKALVAGFVQSIATQDAGSRVYWQLTDQRPLSRLLMRILAKMDQSHMSNTDGSMRNWYSNRPTRFEQELPPDTDGAIDQYYEEQRTLDTAIDESGQSQETIQKLHQRSSPRNAKPIDRILVGTYGFPGNYYPAIFLIDSADRIIASGTTNLSIPRDLSPNPNSSKDDLIPLSPVAKEVLANFNNREGFHRPKPETKNVLMHPTQTDPLAIATSDFVLGLADKKNANVAFLPTDDCERKTYLSEVAGQISARQFRKWLDAEPDMDYKEEDGWVIGTPLDPLLAAKNRLSRHAEEEFLVSMVDEGLSIDSIAHFEMQARPDSNKGVLSNVLMAMTNVSFYDILPQSNGGNATEAGLALFGTLREDQRRLAQKEELKLPAGQMSDQQLDYLHQWLFGYGQTFTPIRISLMRPEEVDALWQTMQGQGFAPEVLGSGLPPDSYLSVIERSVPKFSMKRSPEDGGQDYDYGGGIEDLARVSAHQERPDLYPDDMRTHLDKIWLGKKRNIAVKFIVRDQCQYFEFNEFSRKSQELGPMSIEQLLNALSAEDRNQYMQSVTKFRMEAMKQKP